MLRIAVFVVLVLALPAQALAAARMSLCEAMQGHGHAQRADAGAHGPVHGMKELAVASHDAHAPDPGAHHASPHGGLDATHAPDIASVHDCSGGASADLHSGSHCAACAACMSWFTPLALPERPMAADGAYFPTADARPARMAADRLDRPPRS
ncbi:hypothetical protein [Pigmentiphaga humi]|uniref:hypothetical protein n=1 Tax=Pigmentiphaga humi TaxID=2478468 RepID=UPI000F5241A0|nr:hypothetical protein [Pigmentiphaga humi]